MHFEAEVIALRMRRGERREVVAVAEADLQRARRVAAEGGVEVERPARIEVDAVARPEFVQRAALRVRDATRTNDERTDAAWRFCVVVHISF